MSVKLDKLDTVLDTLEMGIGDLDGARKGAACVSGALHELDAPSLFVVRSVA